MAIMINSEATPLMPGRAQKSHKTIHRAAIAVVALCAVACCALAAIASRGGPAEIPTELAQSWSPAAIARILAQHNAYRKATGATPNLAWDAALQGTAQLWANTLRDKNGCSILKPGTTGEWLHSRCATQDGTDMITDLTQVASGKLCVWGENMAACTGGCKNPNYYDKDPYLMVDQWYDEISNYNHAQGTSTGVSGHYTQLMWAATSKVGCGVASCTEGEVVVCQYTPAGNVAGLYVQNVKPPGTLAAGGALGTARLEWNDPAAANSTGLQSQSCPYINTFKSCAEAQKSCLYAFTCSDPPAGSTGTWTCGPGGVPSWSSYGKKDAPTVYGQCSGVINPAYNRPPCTLTSSPKTTSTGVSGPCNIRAENCAGVQLNYACPTCGTRCTSSGLAGYVVDNSVQYFDVTAATKCGSQACTITPVGLTGEFDGNLPWGTGAAPAPVSFGVHMPSQLVSHQ